MYFDNGFWTYVEVSALAALSCDKSSSEIIVLCVIPSVVSPSFTQRLVLPRTTEVKLLQFSNAFLPMFVSVLGSVAAVISE